LAIRLPSAQTQCADSPSIFSLLRLGHKYYPLALHWQQVSISYSTFFLLPSAKNLGLLVAMAGSKRTNEGTSDIPPVIRRRVE